MYLSSSQYVIKIWVKQKKKRFSIKKNTISRFLIIYYKLFFDLICFSSVLLENKLKNYTIDRLYNCESGFGLGVIFLAEMTVGVATPS